MGKTGLPCGCDPHVEYCPKCFTPSDEYCKRCGAGIESCECPEKVISLRRKVKELQDTIDSMKMDVSCRFKT